MCSGSSFRMRIPGLVAPVLTVCLLRDTPNTSSFSPIPAFHFRRYTPEKYNTTRIFLISQIDLLQSFLNIFYCSNILENGTYIFNGGNKTAVEEGGQGLDSRRASLILKGVALRIFGSNGFNIRTINLVPFRHSLSKNTIPRVVERRRRRREQLPRRKMPPQRLHFPPAERRPPIHHGEKRQSITNLMGNANSHANAAAFEHVQLNPHRNFLQLVQFEGKEFVQFARKWRSDHIREPAIDSGFDEGDAAVVAVDEKLAVVDSAGERVELGQHVGEGILQVVCDFGGVEIGGGGVEIHHWVVHVGGYLVEKRHIAAAEVRRRRGKRFDHLFGDHFDFDGHDFSRIVQKKMQGN